EHRAKQQWAEALATLEKVLAMDRAKHEMVAESVAETMTLVAEFQERKGDWTAAVKTRAEVMEQWKQLKGKDNWRTGEARVRVDEAIRMERGMEQQKQAWQRG